jgi:STE24 endopeptidase
MQTIGTPPNAPQNPGVVYTKRLRAAHQVRVFLQFLLIFLYGCSPLHSWVTATAKEMPVSFMLQVALCWAPVGILCLLCALPFSWYAFHLDRKFGLSRSGLRARLLEAIKAYAVAFVFSGAIVACIFVPHGFSAPLGWLWSAILCSLLYIGLGRAFPWLLSLFYPVATINDPALRERLNRLADKAGIRLANILEWHISGRTRQANALVSGIGPARRILLTDTLIKELSADEVEAIVAHELGHLALHHLWKRTLYQWASFCAILFAINFCVAQGLVWFANQDLGWTDLRLVPGIFLYWQIGYVYGNLFPAALARRQESQADLYSWKLVGSAKPFMTAMRKLAELNLITFDKSEQWKYLHPPTPDRIAAAEKYEMEHSVNSLAQVAGD